MAVILTQKQNMLNEIKYNNPEDITDLSSLLTYCKNTHPSSELRKIAKRFLDRIYQPDMFKQDGYRPPA